MPKQKGNIERWPLYFITIRRTKLRMILIILSENFQKTTTFVRHTGSWRHHVSQRRGTETERRENEIAGRFRKITIWNFNKTATERAENKSNGRRLMALVTKIVMMIIMITMITINIIILYLQNCAGVEHCDWILTETQLNLWQFWVPNPPKVKQMYWLLVEIQQTLLKARCSCKCSNLCRPTASSCGYPKVLI